MPVATFTLGSLGDIASILQLVWQLRAALHAAASASAEIATLTADLDEFTRALLELQAVLERRRPELQPGVTNGVAYALSRCVEILQAVQRKFGSFRTRIVKAVGATAWRAYWAAAAWSILGGKAEVESLRDRLFEQLDIIRVYLAVSQCNDQAILHETMQLQRASIDRLYGIMQDIQARFDVGLPHFLFSSWRRRGGEYIFQPCARTSAHRFYDFCYAYMGDAFFADKVPAEVGPHETTYLTTFTFSPRAGGDRAHVSPDILELTGQGQLSPWTSQPVLDLQCLWFRESAFGEWQVLVGVPSGRLDTQQLLKVLLERRHDIRARCNCDAGPCYARFAEAIAASRLRMKLAESYAEAANTIIRLIDHSTTLATLTDSVLARLFRARPDPTYVRKHVIPRLAECETEFDMFRLLERAPKLSGKKRRWASNFWIGPLANPLVDPQSPWVLTFGTEDPDVVLPLLL